jgi:outer membrane protein TolC
MARQVRCALVLGLIFSSVASTRPVFAQPSPAPQLQPAAAPQATAPASAHSSERAELHDPAALLTGKVGGLTAAQVAERALATSFVAEQRRQEVEVAAANLDRALYDFMPRLSGQVSYFRLSEVEAPSVGILVAAPGAAPGPLAPGQQLVAAPVQFENLQNATTFTASLTLPLSDYVLRLLPARDAAEARLDSSRATLEATRRKTQYDARALYYDWVRAELEAAAAAQNLQLGRENLQHLLALAGAETASLADVARVEATVAGSERVLVQAQNLAALQRERVAIAMHEQARDFAIGEDLTRSPEGPEHDDIAEVARSAERFRPELVAAQRAAEAYDAQATATWSKVLPRLDALGQSTWANPNSRFFPQENEFNGSWQVGLQLSLPFSDSFGARTEVTAAQAQAAAARAQRSQLLDAVRTEASEAVLAQRTARATLASSARRLAAAETSYRARRERFLVGVATTVELTEAQTELFNAQLEAVQAQVAIRVARARVAYVEGR